MIFAELEDLKMVEEEALKAWANFEKMTGYEDPLLHKDTPPQKRWKLQEDFRLFVEFYAPEPEDLANPDLIATKVIGAWILDRVSCGCDTEKQRRASIIYGDERFYCPSRVAFTLNRTFSPQALAHSDDLPREEVLRENRGSYILFYGTPLTSSEIVRLVERHLADKEQREIIRHIRKKYRSSAAAEYVIEPHWYNAKVVTDDDEPTSWDETLACVLHSKFNGL